MVTSDPIADMLVRIRNAGSANKQTVDVPYSSMKLAIANVLLSEGYISSAEKKSKKVSGKSEHRVIEIGLVYERTPLAGTHPEPKIRGAERVSRPSQRAYVGAKAIKPVRQGHGLLVLSTPKGVMSGESARKEHVGGEVLCRVW